MRLKLFEIVQSPYPCCPHKLDNLCLLISALLFTLAFKSFNMNDRFYEMKMDGFQRQRIKRTIDSYSVVCFTDQLCFHRH